MMLGLLADAECLADPTFGNRGQSVGDAELNI